MTVRKQQISFSCSRGENRTYEYDFFLSIDHVPTEGQSGQKLMQNINFLKVMPKYTVKTAEFGQKHQMNDSQNEREVTNLHRKCKNQKTKKISRLGIHIRKN